MVKFIGVRLDLKSFVFISIRIEISSQLDIFHKSENI